METGQSRRHCVQDLQQYPHTEENIHSNLTFDIIHPISEGSDIKVQRPDKKCPRAFVPDSFS